MVTVLRLRRLVVRDFEAWALGDLGRRIGVAGVKVFIPGARPASVPGEGDASVVVGPGGEAVEVGSVAEAGEAVAALGEGCVLAMCVAGAGAFYPAGEGVLRRARGLVGAGDVVVYPGGGERVGFATWEEGASVSGSVAPGGVAPVLAGGRVWLVPEGVL